MTLIEKVLFLQGVDLLGDLSPEQLGRIALITRETYLPPGRALLREGEVSDSMYILISGKVLIESGGQHISEAYEKEVMGTWSLLENEPMVVTATVTEQARVLRIDRDDFYDLMADHSEVMQSIFRVLIRRVRQLVEK